jgi:hypothetical protein
MLIIYLYPSYSSPKRKMVFHHRISSNKALGIDLLTTSPLYISVYFISLDSKSRIIPRYLGYVLG